MEYYVYITNDCNMNCTYCSVLFDTQKYGIPLSPQYSYNTLVNFICETQKKFNDPVADIYFFGGEPTVDYGEIEKLIRVLNTPHEYKINFIMHTNGLLIPEAPKFIINNIDLTLLSFNYELIFEDGQLTPYFGKMIKAIEHLKKQKDSLIIGRITVSLKTSLFTEACMISNFVDYVYWQIDNCERVEKFEKYKNQYEYNISLLFNYWMTCLEKGVFLRFVPFMSAVRNCLQNVPVPEKFYCGYGHSMIYIQTDGKCYACCDNVATKSHYIGDIYNGIQFPDINLKNTICNGCDYIKLCGGRCGRMHKDFSDKRITQYCELNKYMFDMIKNAIPKIEVIIKKHPDYYEKLMDPNISYTEYTA